MPRTLTAALALAMAMAAATLPDPAAAAERVAPRQEYIIVSGGPSLGLWERYRIPEHQHDRWWGNFIRTARIRIEQLRANRNPSDITWLVYRPAYVKRSAEERRSLTDLIVSVREKYGVNLVWFDQGEDVVRYLNNGRNRRQHKISGFEFYGHSNRHCFMFDYSCDISGASTQYLHEDDLGKLKRGLFARDAHVQSYGCHTGESMSAKWKKATGVAMIGAYGKTDYSESWKGRLPHINSGYWKR
jgi:hypothetical protein